MSLRRVITIAVILLVVGVHNVHAQPGGKQSGSDITFNSGQSVQPIFDGWTKNPDGSYEMHFGYLNRNFVEETSVPVGSGNTIEPGGPDRGQPTYFYTRFNHRVFSVTVPRDFGKREVIWTLTVHGKSEKAIGWLQPEWETERYPGAERPGFKSENQPPTITVATPSPVTLPARVTLTARVTDDGLPKPGKARVGGNSENPPTFRFPEATATAPVNVPQLQRPPRPRVAGLSVSWRVHRGPAAVVFEPAVAAVKDGQMVATARFAKPGEYVLRAVASDSLMTTSYDVKVVVVSDAAPQSRP